jgi:hypothetical protein
MKYLTLLLCLIVGGCASHNPYIKIGAGYKIQEPYYYIYSSGSGVYRLSGDPISARIEAGIEVNESISYGISHHSQWLEGRPFNERTEYYKTEFFIDYKYNFKQ